MCLRKPFTDEFYEETIECQPDLYYHEGIGRCVHKEDAPEDCFNIVVTEGIVDFSRKGHKILFTLSKYILRNTLMPNKKMISSSGKK